MNISIATRTVTQALLATTAVGAIALGGIGTAAAAPELLGPVENVDIAQYLGTWNQVAAVPQWFSLNCASNTQANYSIDPDAGNVVVVRNSCDDYFSNPVNIEGRARINDTDTNAQLQVTFVSLAQQWQYFGGTNYVIADLASDYSWAIVGDPNRASGFVLARSASLSEEQWIDIRSRVEALGYNSCVFLTTVHDEGEHGSRPLCTV
ncbi:MAG: lipocalin family protein [Mycobacteriaceae bacterium]